MFNISSLISENTRWAITILFTGAIFSFYGIEDLHEYFGTRNWLPAEAQITSSELKTRHIGGKRPHDVQYLDVTYAYTAGDAKCEGRQYRLGDVEFPWKEEYSVSKVIQIYFDPEAPGCSVARRSSDMWFSVGILCFGAVMILCGIGMFIQDRSP
ncbi:MAG: DUF3592 domain-containing protein [Candidatus Wallbacteria bacterium]|nr:DUF3592 domain-containing protein [Candidatus Wallbacteria bacterium]